MDSKYGCCTGVALTERVYLPQSGNKVTDVLDFLLFVKPFVVKVSLLLNIEIQSSAQVFPVQIIYRITSKHPFFLGNVVVSDFTCMAEYPVKNASVNGYEAVGIECKRS